MHLLDQWLEHMDTQEILPLFQETSAEYRKPGIGDINWNKYPSHISSIIRDGNLAKVAELDSIDEIESVLQLTKQCGEYTLLRDIYCEVLALRTTDGFPQDRVHVLKHLTGFLTVAPYLSKTFLQSNTWTNNKDQLKSCFIGCGPGILRALVLEARAMQSLVIDSFKLVLTELPLLEVGDLVDLVEQISLSVREPELAVDLLMTCLEAEASRLSIERPQATRLLVHGAIGVALDHIDDALGNGKRIEGSILLSPQPKSSDVHSLCSSLRIDSPLNQALKGGDHIRLTAVDRPVNAPVDAPFSMDAIVSSAETGSAVFRSVQPPPPYLRDCSWRVTHCGSFVTSKAMFEALRSFYSYKEQTCPLYNAVVGFSRKSESGLDGANETAYAPTDKLNESQQTARDAALSHRFTLIWGPPGTGKTHTIVEALKLLLRSEKDKRILVTAPTHNAVDNLLEKFVRYHGPAETNTQPIRVSTSLSKVAKELHRYTCDAIVGGETAANFKRMRAAQKKIRDSRLVFTTAVGAGLGLLRDQRFETVIIDEASQLTEPAALIPLSKGCERAILVGDHVQLRPTIQQHAGLLGFDVSLFERHYTASSSSAEPQQGSGMAKVMLDEQYRMHSQICGFSSGQFYASRLRTAKGIDEALEMPESLFPWSDARLIFMQCSVPEEIGRRSKTNQGQVSVCKRICALLDTAPSTEKRSKDKAGRPSRRCSVAILTPYSEQQKLLRSALPEQEVSSIDGFQGREADIVIFVTVRSNLRHEIGFLEDLRRLNVAMTRAKYGVIIVGDKSTLTSKVVNAGQADEDDDQPMAAKETWKRLVEQCVHVVLSEE